MFDKIKRNIFCHKHSNGTVETIEKAETLDRITHNPRKHSTIKCCRGCNRYYLVRSWIKNSSILGIKIT